MAVVTSGGSIPSDRNKAASSVIFRKIRSGPLVAASTRRKLAKTNATLPNINFFPSVNCLTAKARKSP
jgi:hypothetical protein